MVISFNGDWREAGAFGAQKKLLSQIDRETANAQTVVLTASQLGAWDSGFLVVVKNISDFCAKKNIKVDTQGLPEGASRILKLSTATAERKGARREAIQDSFVVRVGKSAADLWSQALSMITFVGELSLALGRLVTGRARYQKRDLFATIDQCGPQGLPIVTLISFLVGLILAFIGAVQLSQFGAQIYVANLVSIAMAREMGALMAGIILAGRTGAAFAAQLGTMQVNEEIDALQTLGIPPIEFLVLPRTLALILMMPLLCIYADLVGMLGGAVIGMGSLGIAPRLYYDQTVSAVALTDFAIGIVKSGVFGVIVAVSGCMRGMQSGRSASAVGQAATSAVVTAIVLIVITDAIFAVACNILGL
ncbi:MAG: ABC transporter permease [Deltaproteobacteria bacterium]|nr:ABC transporter permease [Deltaproteobacteria bacterium]